MSYNPMLISNILHQFHNFVKQRYTFICQNQTGSIVLISFWIYSRITFLSFYLSVISYVNQRDNLIFITKKNSLCNSNINHSIGLKFTGKLWKPLKKGTFYQQRFMNLFSVLKIGSGKRRKIPDPH